MSWRRPLAIAHWHYCHTLGVGIGHSLLNLGLALALALTTLSQPLMALYLYSHRLFVTLLT